MTRIIDRLMQDLQSQRKQLLTLMPRFKHPSLWDSARITEWLEGIVFSEDDLLEQAIEGFCKLEDIIPINDIRDYQHLTVELCLNAWQEAQII